MFFGGLILAAHAASLFLAPSSGNYSLDSGFSVVVKVNSGSTSVNAAEGVLVFDPNKLLVSSLSKNGSIFNLWVQEPEFSNSLGTINFGGIVLNPGFTGSSGNLLTINFRTKNSGNASVDFSSSSVLANDGLGTNVLIGSQGAAYSIGVGAAPPAQAAPRVIPPTISTIASPEIISASHPDLDKWYSNSNPVFKWDVPSEVKEVILVLSRRSKSTPFVKYSPPIEEKTLEDLEDGTWYLHARFRTSDGLGPISTFKLNIDTERPADFSVTRVDTDDPTNPKPEFIFKTSDEVSGIDRYELKIGDEDWFKISPEQAEIYELPLQVPGERIVLIRAYDRADNFSEVEYSLEVESIKPPIIEYAPKVIRNGQTIVISGQAQPFQKVIVYITSDIIKLETFADASGKWSLEYNKLLEEGKSKISAYAIDERGAISVVSNIMLLEVKNDSVVKKIFNLVIGVLDGGIDIISYQWYVILAIAAVGAVIYILVNKVTPVIIKEVKEFIYVMREYKTRKKLKKQDKRLQMEVEALKADIQKELDLLDKIEKHRGLHPDEKYLKSKFEKYLKIIKSF